MYTIGSLVGPSTIVIAIGAHAFCVIFSIRVRTPVNNESLSLNGALIKLVHFEMCCDYEGCCVMFDECPQWKRDFEDFIFEFHLRNMQFGSF